MKLRQIVSNSPKDRSN